MAIDLTKILSISFRDYAACQEKTPLDYEPIGVQVYGEIDKFAQKVPDTAEVVVDYHLEPTNDHPYHYGTALIPKKIRG